MTVTRNEAIAIAAGILVTGVSNDVSEIVEDFADMEVVSEPMRHVGQAMSLLITAKELLAKMHPQVEI